MQSSPGPVCDRVVGRYALYGEIASGGMATVHIGRLLGPVGFSRTVAIKRLHPQFAKDPEFAAMFLDEARLAARIQHPNVVSTLDVVALDGELFLVMEYVQGESLARLARILRSSGARIPPRVAAGIMTGVYHGLHAAHEAQSERGEPLGIVHRDVSPQNVMIGVDGVARVLDFGVAKAAGRMQSTREGQIKGKLPYMSPEQIRGGVVDRRTDVYAASVVLWEVLTGRRLFDGETEGEVYAKVTDNVVPPPTSVCPDLPAAIDKVLLRGLARDPNARYPDARAMANDVEDVLGVASPRHVSEWIAGVAGDTLAKRAERVKEIESISSANVVAKPMLAAARPPPPGSGGQPPPGHLVSPDTSGGGVAPTPPVSQVSSISVTSGIAAPPARPRSWFGFAIAGGVLLGALLIAPIIYLLSRHPSPEAPAPSAAASVAPPPTASVAVAEPPMPAAPAPTSAPGVVASAAPSASALGPRAVAKPPKQSCSPPYTIDARGIRHLKPECL